MQANHIKVKIMWVIVLCVLGLMTGCGGRSYDLSERGQEELADYIGELTNSSVEYEIISIQQAPGYSDGEQKISFASDEDYISGCPDDTGGRNMWCVVLDREVVSTRGKAYSHFLVQNLSGNWYIDELDATEEGEFTYLGCHNWDQSFVSDE